MSRLPPPPPLPRFSSATPERRTAVAPRAARPAPVASSARPRSAPPPLPERARRAPQVGAGTSTRPPAAPQASTRPPTAPQASTRPPAAPQVSTRPPGAPQVSTRPPAAQQASTRPTAPSPRPRTTPPPLPQAKRARARQDSTPTVAQRRPPPRDDRPTEPTPPPSAAERAADIVIDEGETLVMSRAELSAVEVTEPGGFLAPPGSAAPPLPERTRSASSQPVILTSLARPPLVTEEPARLPALPPPSTGSRARPARMESERPVALEITDGAAPARAPRFGWFFAAVAVAAACVLPAAARSYATIAALGAGRAETHLATFVLDPPAPAETATTPEPPKDAPSTKLEPAEKAPAASEPKTPPPAPKARPVVKPRWKK